jgi:hypothetical protein
MGNCFSKNNEVIPLSYDAVPPIEEYVLNYPTFSLKTIINIRRSDIDFIKFMNNSYKKFRKKSM